MGGAVSDRRGRRGGLWARRGSRLWRDRSRLWRLACSHEVTRGILITSDAQLVGEGGIGGSALEGRSRSTAREESDQTSCGDS